MGARAGRSAQNHLYRSVFMSPMAPPLHRNDGSSITAVCLHKEIHVSYIKFKAPDGMQWEVWRVTPTVTGRQRTVVGAGFEGGWLCFESEDGEKRRLNPIPEGWNDAAIDKLWLWCRAAKQVAKCDPPERDRGANP
jgi:hypothetical protein